VLQVQSLEAVIADKKRQVERLVAEMKEANLESLAIAPADEVKHLLEGGFFLGGLGVGVLEIIALFLILTKCNHLLFCVPRCLQDPHSA